MACKCCGVIFNSMYADGNATWAICLYDSDSTLLTSTTIADEDYLQGPQGVSYIVYFVEQALVAGDYYVTVKPSGTADVDFGGLQFPSAALRAASLWPEAANVVAAYRTDDGAWTIDDTALPWVALLLSDITFSGGSPAASGGAFAFVG